MFATQWERDQWQVRQYGQVRQGFREPEEPQDERPRLIPGEPFWSDESERMTYDQAVLSNVQRPDEGAGSYIQRLATIVAGKYQSAGKTIPQRMSRRAMEERLARLRRQAREEAAQAVAP